MGNTKRKIKQNREWEIFLWDEIKFKSTRQINSYTIIEIKRSDKNVTKAKHNCC